MKRNNNSPNQSEDEENDWGNFVDISPKEYTQKPNFDDKKHSSRLLLKTNNQSPAPNPIKFKEHPLIWLVLKFIGQNKDDDHISR